MPTNSSCSSLLLLLFFSIGSSPYAQGYIVMLHKNTHTLTHPKLCFVWLLSACACLSADARTMLTQLAAFIHRFLQHCLIPALVSSVWLVLSLSPHSLIQVVIKTKIRREKGKDIQPFFYPPAILRRLAPNYCRIVNATLHFPPLARLESAVFPLLLSGTGTPGECCAIAT